MRLIVIILQVIVIIALFIESIYILLQRPSKMKLQLFVLTIATIIMMIGYIIEICGENIDVALMGALISYLGKPYVMLSSLLFVLTYCGYNVNKKILIALYLYFTSFIVVVFTNNLHHLFYSNVNFNRDLEFSPLIIEHGFLYYVYVATIVLYLIVCLVVAIKTSIKSKTKETKEQVICIFLLVIFGVAGYVIYITRLSGGYDATMGGCTIGTIMIAILFGKHRLLDVLSLAKEQALYEAENALLVIDLEDRIVYANKFAKDILKTHTIEELKALNEGKNRIVDNNTVYSIDKNLLTSKNRKFGICFEISNITDAYNYAIKLQKAVEERTNEIAHMQRSIIAGFANIVEARSGETGSHIKRTSRYVCLIAKELKKNPKYNSILTDDYINRLVEVSPLHDIGKISISDTILLKPGKLTKEEYEIIKKHTIYGYTIIEDTLRGIEKDEYVNLAEEVALNHHERWDGKGYPNGLKGENIPLSARIMAIADVYEALISKRCYKEPIDKKESFAIITTKSEGHFDPDVVLAFTKCIEKIESIE